jgi:hypothetical protein
MGLIADFRVRSEDLPLVDVAAAVPEATLRVESMQGNPSGPPAFVVSVTGAERGAVDAAFAGATSVRDHSLVVDDGATRRYRCRPAGGPPDDIDTLAENESVSDRIRVTPEGWAERRWFADRAAFDAYRSFCRENDLTFRLDRLLDVDRATGATGTRERSGSGNDDETTGSETSAPGHRAMTDAQREALVTAHEMGYFDVPRNATLADVADELGVAPPSLSERLRRAQSHLVARLRAAEGDIKPRID